MSRNTPIEFFIRISRSNSICRKCSTTIFRIKLLVKASQPQAISNSRLNTSLASLVLTPLSYQTRRLREPSSLLRLLPVRFVIGCLFSRAASSLVRQVLGKIIIIVMDAFSTNNFCFHFSFY